MCMCKKLIACRDFFLTKMFLKLVERVNSKGLERVFCVFLYIPLNFSIFLNKNSEYNFSLEKVNKKAGKDKKCNVYFSYDQIS